MERKKENKDPIKEMAELLKMGAAMLAETCPVEGCNLPLFRLPNGEVICPVHGRVLVVKTEEEAREATQKLVLSDVLDKLENKVLNIIEDMLRDPRPDPGDLIGWLDVLERIRRIKKL